MNTEYLSILFNFSTVNTQETQNLLKISVWYGFEAQLNSEFYSFVHHFCVIIGFDSPAYLLRYDDKGTSLKSPGFSWIRNMTGHADRLQSAQINHTISDQGVNKVRSIRLSRDDTEADLDLIRDGFAILFQ